MKKIFTFLLVSLTTITFAQNFEVEVNDTTVYGLSTQNDFYGDIDLNNTSTSTLSMRWENTERDLPEGWIVSFCDPTECHEPTVQEASFSLPVTGNNNIMNVHFYPNDVQGVGSVTVKLYETATPDNFKVLTYTGTTTDQATSVSTIVVEGKLGQSYPNPNTGTAHVEYEFLSNRTNAKLEVVNLLGQVILSKNIEDNKGTMELNLDRGTYFYSLVNDGQILATKSIVVQ